MSKLSESLMFFVAMPITGAMAAEEMVPRRPAGTFSIVARDPATGEFGVGVQSHWFSVGSAVSWAEAGVGAVATQSFIEPAYGPRGLALMKSGKSAREALEELLSTDDARDVRQVAFIDAQGRMAAHTGKLCIPFAGDRTVRPAEKPLPLLFAVEPGSHGGLSRRFNHERPVFRRVGYAWLGRRARRRRSGADRGGSVFQQRLGCHGSYQWMRSRTGGDV